MLADRVLYLSALGWCMYLASLPHALTTLAAARTAFSRLPPPASEAESSESDPPQEGATAEGSFDPPAPPARWQKRVATVAVATAVLIYGGKCYVQNRVWRSEFSLWEHAYKINPLGHIVQSEYGKSLANVRRWAPIQRSTPCQRRPPRPKRQGPTAEGGARGRPVYSTNTPPRLFAEPCVGARRYEEAIGVLKGALNTSQDSLTLMGSLGLSLVYTGRCAGLPVSRGLHHLYPGSCSSALHTLGVRDESAESEVNGYGVQVRRGGAIPDRRPPAVVEPPPGTRGSPSQPAAAEPRRHLLHRAEPLRAHAGGHGRACDDGHQGAAPPPA